MMTNLMPNFSLMLKKKNFYWSCFLTSFCFSDNQNFMFICEQLQIGHSCGFVCLTFPHSKRYLFFSGPNIFLLSRLTYNPPHNRKKMNLYNETRPFCDPSRPGCTPVWIFQKVGRTAVSECFLSRKKYSAIIDTW